MSEAAFWRRVRTTLHAPPTRVCRKLTDAYTAGTPDCYYVIDGRVGFLELKYRPRWPARPSTPVRPGVTVEQHRYLELLAGARAPAHVLLGIGRDFWALVHPTGLTPDGAYDAAALRRGRYGAVGRRLAELVTTLARGPVGAVRPG